MDDRCYRYSMAETYAVMQPECYRYSMTDTRAVMQPLSWLFQTAPGENPSWDLFARGEIREILKHADSRARAGGSQQSFVLSVSTETVHVTVPYRLA